MARASPQAFGIQLHAQRRQELPGGELGRGEVDVGLGFADHPQGGTRAHGRIPQGGTLAVGFPDVVCHDELPTPGI